MKATFALALLLFLAVSCSTPHIDWSSRVGTYTYDQAVMELGPPDKFAKLSDGSSVAEWLTSRGSNYQSVHLFPSYYGYEAGGFYHLDDFNSPDRFIRLSFSPDGKLTTWKKVIK